MKYIFTDFYSEFKCNGGECLNTCCKGWDIFVDNNTYDLYTRLPETIKNAICSQIEEVNKGENAQYQFRMREDGSCPFLNSQNLCDIYSQVSADALCQVCKTFPRKIIIYYDVVMATVSVACPEVVRLLLERKDPIQFGYSEDLEQIKIIAPDWSLYNELINGLVMSVNIIQDRKYPFWYRVHMIINLTNIIQEHIDGEKIGVLREEIECFKEENFRKQYVRTYHLSEHSMTNKWKTIYNILKEIGDVGISLVEKYPDIQKYKNIDSFDEEKYLAWSEGFQTMEDEVELENLSLEFIFEYYMDAIKGKSLLENVVKMILLLLEIRVIEIINWGMNGSLSGEDKMLMISRICRCMENSKLLDIVAKRMIDNNENEQLLQLAYLLH